MMNSLQWTSIDLVVDASPGRLASEIKSELSLLLLTSIGGTIDASLHLQFVGPKSV
jgi:hypothetical protein